MGYPGVDYSKIASQSVGPLGQFTQGIDPDWTALAQAYGFQQNPFPAAGTEGQDQMRFLATLKNIMDAQLGGAGGRYAQMSPGNPIASMPFGMRQYMTGAGNLFNSIQGRNLMPMSQADMFGGGYQFGGLDTGTVNPLMYTLGTARGSMPAGFNVPANAQAVMGNTGSPAGPSPISASTTTQALPAAGESTASTDNNGQTAAAAQEVTGGNDTASNPPASTDTTNPTVSASTTTQTTGAQDIAAALKAQDDSLPKFGYDTERKGDNMVLKGTDTSVAHLENGRWTQSNDESQASQQASGPSRTAAAIGEKVSDLGTNVHNIVQSINQLDLSARNQLINMLGGR